MVVLIPCKRDFEKSGGIRAVVWLIENQREANPTGDSVPAELHMDERMQSALENASAILCNLSSMESLRWTILTNYGVLPCLVKHVLEPVAAATFNQFDNCREYEDPAPYTCVHFRNVSAVVRYFTLNKHLPIITIRQLLCTVEII